MREITTNGNDDVTGVTLKCGSEVRAKVVLSNATAKVTFMDLLPQVKIFVSDFDIEYYNIYTYTICTGLVP